MIVRWLVVVLVILNGGWMAFDGTRALMVGDYVTPASGPYAGQLGPWAAVVSAAGLAPRGTLVKWIFVGYGLAALAAATAFAFRRAGGRSALLVLVPLGLWYLPFGTAINLVVLPLLFLRSLRT